MDANTVSVACVLVIEVFSCHRKKAKGDVLVRKVNVIDRAKMLI